MKQAPDQDKAVAKQGRITALVIAGTTVLWLVGQWLGPRLGLDARYVFLFDLAALAGYFWALVTIYQIWRKRQNS